MTRVYNFVVDYPTVTATLALAGALAIAGLWLSMNARLAERRRRLDPGRR